MTGHEEKKRKEKTKKEKKDPLKTGGLIGISEKPSRMIGAEESEEGERK